MHKNEYCQPNLLMTLCDFLQEKNSVESIGNSKHIGPNPHPGQSHQKGRKLERIIDVLICPCPVREVRYSLLSEHLTHEEDNDNHIKETTIDRTPWQH